MVRVGAVAEQERDDARRAARGVAGGEMDRTISAAARLYRVGIGRVERFDDGGVACVLTGDHHRRRAVFGLGRRQRVVLRQQPGDERGGLSGAQREHQRRPAVRVGGVDVGAAFDEPRDPRRVALVRRQHERGTLPAGQGFGPSKRRNCRGFSPAGVRCLRGVQRVRRRRGGCGGRPGGAAGRQPDQDQQFFQIHGKDLH